MAVMRPEIIQNAARGKRSKHVTRSKVHNT